MCPAVLVRRSGGSAMLATMSRFQPLAAARSRLRPLPAPSPPQCNRSSSRRAAPPGLATAPGPGRRVWAGGRRSDGACHLVNNIPRIDCTGLNRNGGRGVTQGKLGRGCELSQVCWMLSWGELGGNREQCAMPSAGAGCWTCRLNSTAGSRGWVATH